LDGKSYLSYRTKHKGRSKIFFKVILKVSNELYYRGYMEARIESLLIRLTYKIVHVTIYYYTVFFFLDDFYYYLLLYGSSYLIKFDA
jgi:hypothetical protein